MDKDPVETGCEPLLSNSFRMCKYSVAWIQSKPPKKRLWMSRLLTVVLLPLQFLEEENSKASLSSNQGSFFVFSLFFLRETLLNQMSLKQTLANPTLGALSANAPGELNRVLCCCFGGEDKICPSGLCMTAAAVALGAKPPLKLWLYLEQKGPDAKQPFWFTHHPPRALCPLWSR